MWGIRPPRDGLFNSYTGVLMQTLHVLQRRPVSAALAALLLPILAAAGGCGPAGSTVSGKVTCSGKPVKGAVTFSPKGEGAANTGEAATAALDADGKFTLKLK